MGFAAINYTIIHSPFVLLATFVLLVHELAHYFYAKSYGAKVNMPIILPLPFFAIAFVKVKDLLDRHKSDVAIAGLIFGSLTIFIYSLFNIFSGFISFYVLAIMFILEIVFNLIGSDGSKYRKYSCS
jgi:Zn-dependent protease